ncbi:FAD-binding oxidoreductase [Sphingobacterium tabacisoli]|uniref:FAD-binding oxidoreductase n=1 Tax=Sphingobacterium tabacisoli TaxID=2044855 RepID=A0ABW5L6Q3_9SPHI|nr:FAD-binding oxidoreductase [Sphingobacterium tabacisoli]
MPTAPKWLFDTLDLFMSKLPGTEVVRTEYLSPSVKLIKLTGLFDELHVPVGAFFDIRISDTEARRYTISSINRENSTLDLIVYLHGQGPGSKYMDGLQRGDEIYLNKPRTDQKYHNHLVENLVFFGDETSLALAISFLPVVREHGQQIQFIFELDEENRNVPQVLGINHSLVFPKGEIFRDPESIAAIDVLKYETWKYFVLTGNVKSVQAFRKAVKMHMPSKVKAHGFWLEGKNGL